MTTSHLMLISQNIWHVLMYVLKMTTLGNIKDCQEKAKHNRIIYTFPVTQCCVLHSGVT